MHCRVKMKQFTTRKCLLQTTNRPPGQKSCLLLNSFKNIYSRNFTICIFFLITLTAKYFEISSSLKNLVNVSNLQSRVFQFVNKWSTLITLMTTILENVFRIYYYFLYKGLTKKPGFQKKGKDNYKQIFNEILEEVCPS